MMLRRSLVPYRSLSQSETTAFGPGISSPALDPIGTEGVAGIDPATVDPALDPPDALLGRAVGEGIWHGITLRFALQPVVADRGSRLHRLLDIARLEDMTGAIGVVGPDPGEAIGLQLQADGRRVGSGLGTGPHRIHLVHDAHEVLHMVPDLMRDHIGAGKVSRR